MKYKSIKIDYLWRALQLLGKEGVTFFIFLIAAKILTPLEFGLYNYLMAFIFFLIIFSDFGISSATSKFVAEYHITDKAKLKSIFFNAIIAITLLSIIVVILTLVFSKKYFGESYEYLMYLLPLIILAPLTSLYDGIYRGLKKFRQLSIITISAGLFSLPFIIYLIIVEGLYGALLAQIIFFTILLIALGISYRDWNFVFNKSIIIDLSKYSFIIGIASVGYFFFSRINILILGHFGYIEEIGYYEIINKIFILLLIPFSILSQVIAPHVTQRVAINDKVWVVSKYKTIVLLSGIVGLCLAFIVYLALPLVIKLFLTEYNVSEISLMLLYLLPILVTQSMSAVAATGFSTASGHARLNMYFLLVFGIFNIVLTILFIKLFGFWGVIYSTLIVKTLSDITFLIFYYKYIRITNSNKHE